MAKTKRNLVAAVNMATHRKSRFIPAKKGKGAVYKRRKKVRTEDD